MLEFWLTLTYPNNSLKLSLWKGRHTRYLLPSNMKNSHRFAPTVRCWAMIFTVVWNRAFCIRRRDLIVLIIRHKLLLNTIGNHIRLIWMVSTLNCLRILFSTTGICPIWIVNILICLKIFIITTGTRLNWLASSLFWLGILLRTHGLSLNMLCHKEFFLNTKKSVFLLMLMALLIRWKETPVGFFWTILNRRGSIRKETMWMCLRLQQSRREVTLQHYLFTILSIFYKKIVNFLPGRQS